jgi:hypothetical protein
MIVLGVLPVRGIGLILCSYYFYLMKWILLVLLITSCQSAERPAVTNPLTNFINRYQVRFRDAANDIQKAAIQSEFDSTFRKYISDSLKSRLDGFAYEVYYMDVSEKNIASGPVHILDVTFKNDNHSINQIEAAADNDNPVFKALTDKRIGQKVKVWASIDSLVSDPYTVFTLRVPIIKIQIDSIN